MGYPPHLCGDIFPSIFRDIKREEMYVKKETIDEHFKNVGKVNGTGRGRFIKKIRDSLYAESW